MFYSVYITSKVSLSAVSCFYCKDKVFFAIACVVIFSLCFVPWMGGSGERFPVMVAPRAVILLSAPAQRCRSLCGAVCFVVHGVVFFGLIGFIEGHSMTRRAVWEPWGEWRVKR